MEEHGLAELEATLDTFHVPLVYVHGTVCIRSAFWKSVDGAASFELSDGGAALMAEVEASPHVQAVVALSAGQGCAASTPFLIDHGTKNRRILQ